MPDSGAAIDPLESWQCARLNKNCRECGWRRKKGDRRVFCPDCGDDTRCRNKKMDGRKTCRMHGHHQSNGVFPGQKYHVARDIHKAFNRIKSHPDFATLKQEIGIVAARIDELQRLADSNGVNGSAAAAIEAARSKIETGLITGNATTSARGLAELKDALSPIMVKDRIWAEMRENLTVLQRLMDSQHKWDMDNEQYVHISQLFEVITYFQRKFFKYLRDPVDRKNFISELREEIVPPPALLNVKVNVSDRDRVSKD